MGDSRRRCREILKTVKKSDRTQICTGSKGHLGLGFPHEPILRSDHQPGFTIDRRRRPSRMNGREFGGRFSDAKVKMERLELKTAC